MSEQHKVDVDVEVTLRLVVADAGPVPLQVSLRYSAQDPYAVRAVFRGGDAAVEWVFARDLLVTGLREASGLGDVHVWPSRGPEGDIVVISLSSPDGRAVLHADADDMRRFVARTVRVVAPGTEEMHLDLDDVIARLTT